MLGFIRRLTKSRVGVIVTLAILAVIAIAFAAGDISNVRQGGAGPTGNAVAEVAGVRVTDVELTDRARREVEIARQRQPGVDMTQFIAAGGLESLLERIMSGVALDRFGQESGLVVSQRAVDGQIASIPAFQGFDGKFSQQAFEARLAQERISPSELRADIARDTMSQWLIAPTVGASQMPEQLALPYASLLLEQRSGQSALIPLSAVAPGAAPTDQELAAYYATNRGRYMVPERRVIRYAVVTPASLANQTAPSEQEIAAAYRGAGTRFAASEQRSVRQVIVADQAGATALAGRVRGGQSIDATAQAAGLSATAFDNLSKADLAGRTNAAVADAAFAAAEGAVAGPVRSPLGWHVLRVERVAPVAGKTLEQARPELVAELTRNKLATVLGQVQGRIDTAITDGSTFDEIVADAKLQAQRTAPLTAGGIDPENPATAPDPALANVLQAGFAAQPGDDPQIVQTGSDGTFAVVAAENVVAAAPRPLAQIRQTVAQQLIRERQLRAARTIAQGVVDKVNRGMPLAQALGQTGVSTPAAQSLRSSRAELAQRRGDVSPALALMFSMAEKKAKLAPAPDAGGWVVVYLDQIRRGNAAGNDRAIQSTRQGLGGVIGREYAEQFAQAVRRQVGAKRNEQTIARVRSELGGLGNAAE